MVVVEVGGTPNGDEAELARMGYKQELKCVQFSSSFQRCLLKFMTLVIYQARSDIVAGDIVTK